MQRMRKIICKTSDTRNEKQKDVNNANCRADFFGSKKYSRNTRRVNPDAIRLFHHLELTGRMTARVYAICSRTPITRGNRGTPRAVVSP